MRNAIRLTAFAALAVAFSLAGQLVFAQGIIFPERPEMRDQPFSVKSVRVSASISDGICETTVEQVFVNNANFEQEGTYLFPLPEGASVSSFSLRAGERVIEGRLLGKDEARGIYESIVRRRKDPALLEYVGRGLFRSSVFPIPAHGERTLTLKYTEVLKSEGGLKRYGYTLSTGRFSSRPIQVSSIVVRLNPPPPLKTVYSPTHDVSVRRNDDHSAIASWEGHGEFPDRDFALYYGTSSDDVGLNLITYQSGIGDGYFMLIASPRFSVPKDRILPKQIVFVLDRTGSMQPNGKMDQAKAALHYCVSNLNPQDRFDVITFNESTDILTKSLVQATPENVKRAQKFASEVDASGGTNIDEALRAALGLLKPESGSQKMIVFLTDGLPTIGETNIETILANVRRINGGSRLASAGAFNPDEATGVRSRIFCFGVGYDVNVPFLDRLAEENRADADYVRPQESIESIVSAFYAKVSSPILSSLKLAFDGAEVYDVYPKTMPDLFKGGQVVVTGRYRGSPHGSVRLTGYAQDKPATFTLTDGFGENGARSGMIPRIWAARKIGYLLDQVRLHANQEVIDEIVRLSKEYGIITPYTAYLADERQDMAFRPRFADGTNHYDLDGSVLRLGEAEARQELNRLGGRGRGETGAEETHRSLNSKEYQSANRAPAGSQGFGGFGGGGAGGPGQGDLRDRIAKMPSISGGAFGGVRSDNGRELAKKDIGLDYLKAGDETSLNDKNEPGYKRVQANARVQAVAGRVFYKRGTVWFDNNYPSGRKVVKVRSLSDAHFQLIHALPSLTKYASVGDEVLIDLGKIAVQLGNEGKEKLTDAEVREITGK